MKHATVLLVAGLLGGAWAAPLSAAPKPPPSGSPLPLPDAPAGSPAPTEGDTLDLGGQLGGLLGGHKSKRQLVLSDILADLETIDLAHTAKREAPAPSASDELGILDGLLGNKGKGVLPGPGGKDKRQLILSDILTNLEGIDLGHTAKRDLPVPSDALGSLAGVLPEGGKSPVPVGQTKRQLPTGAQGGDAAGANPLAGALGNLIPGLGGESVAANPQQ